MYSRQSPNVPVHARDLDVITGQLQIHSSDDSQRKICSYLDRLELECTVGLSEVLEIIEEFKPMVHNNLIGKQTLCTLEQLISTLRVYLLLTMDRRDPDQYLYFVGGLRSMYICLLETFVAIKKVFNFHRARIVYTEKKKFGQKISDATSWAWTKRGDRTAVNNALPESIQKISSAIFLDKEPRYTELSYDNNDDNSGIYDNNSGRGGASGGGYIRKPRVNTKYGRLLAVHLESTIGTLYHLSQRILIMQGLWEEVEEDVPVEEPLPDIPETPPVELLDLSDLPPLPQTAPTPNPPAPSTAPLVKPQESTSSPSTPKQISTVLDLDDIFASSEDVPTTSYSSPSSPTMSTPSASAPSTPSFASRRKRAHQYRFIPFKPLHELYKRHEDLSPSEVLGRYHFGFEYVRSLVMYTQKLKAVYCAVHDVYGWKDTKMIDISLIKDTKLFSNTIFYPTAAKYFAFPSMASDLYEKVRTSLTLEVQRDVWNLMEDPVIEFFATLVGLNPPKVNLPIDTDIFIDSAIVPLTEYHIKRFASGKKYKLHPICPSPKAVEMKHDGMEKITDQSTFSQFYEKKYSLKCRYLNARQTVVHPSLYPKKIRPRDKENDELVRYHRPSAMSAIKGYFEPRGGQALRNTPTGDSRSFKKERSVNGPEKSMSNLFSSIFAGSRGYKHVDNSFDNTALKVRENEHVDDSYYSETMKENIENLLTDQERQHAMLDEVDDPVDDLASNQKNMPSIAERVPVVPLPQPTLPPTSLDDMEMQQSPSLSPRRKPRSASLSPRARRVVEPKPKIGTLVDLGDDMVVIEDDEVFEDIPVDLDAAYYDKKYEQTAATLDSYSPVVILHIHGGGWIAQSPRTHLAYLRRWADQTCFPIISLDYTLSPQSEFPGAVNESFAAYKWLLDPENAKTIGLPVSNQSPRIILAGDSAGANLCCALTIRLIDEGLQMPIGLLLSYPVVLLTVSGSIGRLIYANDPILNYQSLHIVVDSYLHNNKELGATEPLMSPILLSDEMLKLFPPTVIMVGDRDPLIDDSTWLFKRMKDVGVDCTLHIYKYLPHGYLNLPSQLPNANIAIADASAYMKKMMYNDDQKRGFTVI